MGEMAARQHYVVTPWRTSAELLQLRRDLYSRGESHEDVEDKRENAVNKVFAWRLRKQDMPLLLESTADIVDVILQDEKGGLTHNALRLLYATAVSRFITGLADTQIELSRSHPSWFPPGKSFQLPASLLETRHRIVHRYLPSLAELKRAAKESLDWLWEWYWSHLDHAFNQEASSDAQADVRERCQMILKTYVKERKNEIKSRKKESRAADTALSTYNMRFSPSGTSMPNTMAAKTLAELLVDDKAVLPTDKKLGNSMSGAFVIWTPFLLVFISAYPSFLHTVLNRVISIMDAPSRGTVDLELDPAREGMYEWALHMLTSNEWQDARQVGKQGQEAKEKERNFVDSVLATCFTHPGFWNLKLAEGILRDESTPNRAQWMAVFHAAKSEDGMDVDITTGAGEEMDVDTIDQGLSIRDDKMSGSSDAKSITRGPQKVLGLWKPRPIGYLPEGWEEDE